MPLPTMQLVEIRSADQYQGLPTSVGLPAFDPRLLEQHQPDAHWAVVDADGVAGHCSLWWHNTPAHGAHRVGLIGHYAAGANEAAEALLSFACEQLAEQGCIFVVGPVDGNTWRDYRFVTDPGDAPRFFLEPHNPPEWPEQFVANGFEELARYFSAVVDDLSITTPRVERVQKRMDERGVRIRNLCPESFATDLRQIYGIVESVFRDHLLFAPIGESAFLKQFEPLRSCVPPDLVLIAEQREQAVGFCFGLPDVQQARRGEPIDTAILKTFGVLPGRAFAGLGQLLLERFHQRARELGYRRVIHALVREAGHVQRISRRYAVPIRRYTLFARRLDR